MTREGWEGQREEKKNEREDKREKNGWRGKEERIPR
jgi:hypothetical protein